MRKSKSSNYKGVSKSNVRGKVKWIAQYNANGHNWAKWCGTEREAAIAYDVKMVQIGKEPINVLIRK